MYETGKYSQCCFISTMACLRGAGTGAAEKGSSLEELSPTLIRKDGELSPSCLNSPSWNAGECHDTDHNVKPVISRRQSPSCNSAL